MWKENLYQSIEILVREHSLFPIQEHQHSFFEVAYILQGSGAFYAYLPGKGKVETVYQTGSIFLIPPDVTHCFTIHSYSRFIFVRFTSTYVSGNISPFVERILSFPSDSIINLSERDVRQLPLLFDLLLCEHQFPGHFSEQLLQCHANSLILLIARNLSSCMLESDVVDDRPMYMMHYIQQHIHQPELLKTEVLCREFNLSSTYIGRYFKRNFQEDLQQYIVRNRIRMVENLLINSRMTVKEIAYRSGYSDASYLVRVFHKFYGVSPLEYRKQHGM